MLESQNRKCFDHKFMEHNNVERINQNFMRMVFNENRQQQMHFDSEI